MKKFDREQRKVVYKKSKFLARFFLIFSLVIILTVVSFFSYKVINKYINNSNSISTLYEKWNAYDYQSVYDISGSILEKKPLQNTARTFRGYSAFFLSVSQVDNTIAQNYLDESIINLRIALLYCKDKISGQVEYMLGKAYFYKDSMSSYHYYADLAIKFLKKSIEHNYKSNDTSEYLGLCYAALGDTQSSISSFTDALLVRESDTLLLAIAEQYYKADTGTAAKQYLYRVIDISQNEDVILRSHILLGEIYIDEDNLSDAEKEFNTILEKNENSADAHYGLGVLYEKQGDVVKARSEWRKCLRIQVNHAGALQKMAESK